MFTYSPTLSPHKGEKKFSSNALSESSKKRSSSSLIYSSFSQFNPASIIREANSLNNRLEKAEKKIKEIRSDIPQNMIQMLENLELSSKKIINNPSSIEKLEENLHDDNEMTPDITEQLELLETELKSEIKSKFTDYNEFIKNKINLISYNIQKANSKQGNRLERYSNDIENSINDFQRKEQKKLDDLEESLNKLKKYSQPIENIAKYSEIVDSNTLQIKNIQKKLSTLTLQVNAQCNSKKKDSSNVFITSSNLINTKRKDTNSYDNHFKIFEAQNKIESIHEEINAFKEKFGNYLFQSYQKIQNCEYKMIEIEHIYDGIKSSFQVLENKLIMEEMMISELFDKIEKLEKKSKDKADILNLQMISEQIKSSRNNMQSILSSIKNKVKKCELSIPLIKFD